MPIEWPLSSLRLGVGPPAKQILPILLPLAHHSSSLSIVVYQAAPQPHLVMHLSHPSLDWLRKYRVFNCIWKHFLPVVLWAFHWTWNFFFENFFFFTVFAFNILLWRGQGRNLNSAKCSYFHTCKQCHLCTKTVTSCIWAGFQPEGHIYFGFWVISFHLIFALAFAICFCYSVNTQVL